jgi:hypothetical protein
MTADERMPEELRLDLVLPLLLQRMEATVVEEPGTKERKYAYEVTFMAVLPEPQVRFLVNYLTDHKVRVRCIRPDEFGGRDVA